jgi:hypothetical protein
MSPKEKAIELVTNMSFSKSKVADYVTGEMVDIPGNIYAKQCTLIAVDEIINNNNKIPGNAIGLHTDINSNFWEQVKQEIEKL